MAYGVCLLPRHYGAGVLGYSSVGFGAWLLRFFAGSCLFSGGLVFETRRGVGGGHWAEVFLPHAVFLPRPGMYVF